MSKLDQQESLCSVLWDCARILVEKWKAGESFKFPFYDNLDTVEKLLKLSHHFEIEARKTAKSMPQEQCSLVCMNLYSYIVYVSKNEFMRDSIYSEDILHIYALEAIRILQYGAHEEEEEDLYSNDDMILLLRQIENMVSIREIAKRLNAGIIEKPEKILFEDRIRLAKEDQYFIKQIGEHYCGKGKRLRLAEDTTHFLFESDNRYLAFTKFLKDLISGTNTKNSIQAVKGTYFEFLPQMQQDDAEFEGYSKFINSLIRRIEFTKNFMKEQENSVGGVFNAGIVGETSIPKEMIYIPRFRRWNIGDEEKINLFQTPVIKLNHEKYATCFALCGDSLNSWVERELKKDCGTTKWKQGLLQKIEFQFEKEVNDFMMKKGYQSGSLKENGEWNPQNQGAHSIKLPVKISGECDALAINDKTKMIFLIECKRLHDAVSSNEPLKIMESVRKKVLQKFIPKLSKKREEIRGFIESMYPDYEFCSAMVTDVNFPIYIPEGKKYSEENNVIYCSFDSLKESVENRQFPKNAIFIRNNFEKGT